METAVLSADVQLLDVIPKTRTNIRDNVERAFVNISFLVCSVGEAHWESFEKAGIGEDAELVAHQ